MEIIKQEIPSGYRHYVRIKIDNNFFTVIKKTELYEDNVNEFIILHEQFKDKKFKTYQEIKEFIKEMEITKENLKSITEMYHRLKLESEHKTAVLTYATKNENTINFHTKFIDFSEDEKVTINNLLHTSEDKNFYLYVNSKKGMKWVEDNSEEIALAFRNMILMNAGF